MVQSQSPLAAILSCSDSRVPPEHVLDKKIGEIFVVRVAGQITGTAIVGSLEYAVEHLKVPLLLVLGHEGAGIVTEVGPGTTRFRIDDHVVFTAQTDIPMLLDFHHQGRLDLDRMVSKIYAIDEIHQAFIDMQENVNAKGVIVFAQ